MDIKQFASDSMREHAENPKVKSFDYIPTCIISDALAEYLQEHCGSKRDQETFVLEGLTEGDNESVVSALSYALDTGDATSFGYHMIEQVFIPYYIDFFRDAFDEWRGDHMDSAECGSSVIDSQEIAAARMAA